MFYLILSRLLMPLINSCRVCKSAGVGPACASSNKTGAHDHTATAPAWIHLGTFVTGYLPTPPSDEGSLGPRALSQPLSFTNAGPIFLPGNSLTMVAPHSMASNNLTLFPAGSGHIRNL